LSGLPRPTACRVAEHLFGRPAEELFAIVPSTAAHLAHAAVPWSDNRTLAQLHPTEPPGSRVPGPAAVVDLEYDPIMSSAHDASDHAAEAGRAIEETTLVQLHAEVTRLAHAYASTPPLVMFAYLRRARDLAYRMLERTRRPAQLADLYLIAGQLSGLMAGVSFDAGHPDAAGEQARAALTYGQIIDHPTLRGYARATLAMIALWSGRPSDGVTHATAGLQDVATGDTAVRLHCLAGRSWALAGSAEQATTQVRAAEEARQHRTEADPFADGIGGEFAFGPARHALCLGATHLALSDPTAAARHTQAALDLYESGPAEQRAIGGVHGARVELATARAMAIDLDAVLDAVTPTLDLVPEQRTHRLATRLHGLRRQLAANRYQGSPQAAELTDAIETFLATTVTSGLAAPMASSPPALG
jgi:hypothetical protein